MIHVTYIPCLFDESSWVRFETYNLKPITILFEMVRKYPELREDEAGINIRVNGKLIHPLKWNDAELKDGDKVTIIQEIGGTVILTSIFGSLIYIGGGIVIPTGIVGFLVNIVIVMCLNLVISALTKPSAQKTGQGLNNSPTYGWDGISMNTQPGMPVPVIYGEHLTGGTLIGCFISTDGDKNYINLLIALGEGEIEGIMKEDMSGVCTSTEDAPYILVNDNMFSNFLEAGETTIQWDYRLGTQDQTTITGFNDLRNVYDTGGVLFVKDPSPTEYYYTTQDSTVEAFELLFRIPAIFIQYKGNYYPSTCKAEIYHRVAGTEDWIDDGEWSFHGTSQTALRRIFRLDNLEPNQYDIKVVLTKGGNVNPGYPDAYYLDEVTEIQYQDLAYPHTALVGIKILATDKLSGAIPNVQILVRGRKVKNLETSNTEWSSNPVYCVNDLLVTKRFGLGKYLTQSNINNDQLIEGANYSDELVGNGTLGHIDAVDANSLTCLSHYFHVDPVLYDPTTFTQYVETDIGRTLCCKSPNDSTIYTKMVITSISEDGNTVNGTGGWSDGTPSVNVHWEFGEPRSRLDLVIDTQDKALDSLQQICSTFRCLPVWSKNNIQLYIDKKQDPCYIFNMGNIIAGSWKHTFLSEKGRFNDIQIDYADRMRRYVRETVDVTDWETISGGVPQRVKKISLFGVTRNSQAYREGRWMLLQAKNLKQSTSFTGGIDAVHMLPGEVVLFQHDVPKWGYGGRIVSGTLSTITLDQSVTIEADKTYAVTIRQLNEDGKDSLETRTVTNDPGAYTVLSVTPDFSIAPASYSLYLFGEQGVNSKPFLIMQVTKTPQNEIEVIASEYSDNCYIDTEMVTGQKQYSPLPSPYIVPQVTNLSLKEGGTMLGDGTWNGFIEVGFKKPIMTNIIGWDHSEIWISLDPNASTFIYYGRTDKEFGFTIDSHYFLQPLNTVYVKVVSVTSVGTKSNFNSAPYAGILVQGKIAPPSDVENFQAIQYGNKIILSWDAIPDLDVAYYEIREGSTWDVSQVIGIGITGSPFEWYTFSVGTLNLMIKSFDRSGNESVNETSVVLEVTEGPTTRIVATLDGLSNPAVYSSTARQIWPALDQEVVGLESAQGWDDGDWDDGSYWDIPVAALTGYFETEPLDFGEVQGILIKVNDQYILADSNQTSSIEVSISDDGDTWSDYITFVGGQYSCRYVKFKINLETDDESKNLFVSKFKETGMLSTGEIFTVTTGNEAALKYKDQLGHEITLSTVLS
jgi:predicted phage tail protein/molybdopterin converting factor small subunit